LSESSVSTSKLWGSITPSDVTVLRSVRALYVLTDGNLNLEDSSGNQIVFPVTTGQVLPVQPSKVLSTSTTATCAALY